MTNPDAYLVDRYYDPEIIDVGQETDEALEGETMVPLLLLASFDHGLRTADETAQAIGTECVGQVCRAFYVACGIPWCNGWAIGGVHSVDWDAAMVDGIGLAEVEGWYVDPDDSQALYEWQQYEAEPMFWHAGGIVETSADSGMTWLYVPMARD